MYTAPHWKSPIALNGLAYYKSNDEVDKCLTISLKLPPIIHFLSDFRNRKIELTLMVTHEWILFAMGSLSAANEKIEIHSESGARHRRHPPLRAARFINSSVILNFVHRRVHFTKNHDQKKVGYKICRRWAFSFFSRRNIFSLVVITLENSQCRNIGYIRSFQKPISVSDWLIPNIGTRTRTLTGFH